MTDSKPAPEAKALPSGERAVLAASGRSTFPLLWRAWRHGYVMLLLSILPGAPQAYVGNWRRAVLLSALFLLLLSPVLSGLIILWSFRPTAAVVALTILVGICLAGAIGPARTLLASCRRGSPPYRTSRRLLGYVWLVAVLALVQIGFYVTRKFASVRVESAQLAPILERGSNAPVFKSSYCRPVHGDVVLFNAQAILHPQGPATLPVLGRVVACGRDTIELRQGKLFVNDVEFLAARVDQRREIERARRRLKASLKRRGSWLRTPQTFWLAPEDSWGPFRLDKRLFLVLPDRPDNGGERAGAPRVWTVSGSAVMGRVVY